jgi:DNA-binding LacI/PurR family transcriptional regulator
MSASLKTIAELAGVTEATVSMALRNMDRISVKRRRQISEIARELNYTPNLNARGLSTGKSHLIGLISATNFVEVSANLTDHFEQAVRENGYQLIGSFHQGRADLEIRNIRELIARGADGAVGFPVHNGDHSAWQLLTNANIPAVLFNESPSFPHSHVMIDFEDGGRQMVHHLLASGYRNPAFVSTDSSSNHILSRIHGWRKACEDADIDFQQRPMFWLKNDSISSSQPDLIAQIRDNPIPFDSLLASTDLVAIASIRALHDQGLKIPEDVAIVGFDDSLVASILPIPLSSVRQPVAEAAKIAAEILLRQINNPGAEFEQVLLKPSLIVRQSSTSRRRRG